MVFLENSLIGRNLVTYGSHKFGGLCIVRAGGDERAETAKNCSMAPYFADRGLVVGQCEWKTFC